MPSEKKKKAKLKKPKTGDKTKVKVEPIDIKPLTTYIDDRVELIRQTFMCLKPKTVKQIAPDFLQGKSIEKIQEYCLDEVLGISKKRLISIINNTKCPTDTESEDSDDSDVQKVEGHISLEEISSDSDEGGKRKPAKKSANVARAATSNDKQVQQNGKSGKNEKEMTVLELLELQARARAIRSQLAQEPVTKIELKSDSEGDDEPQQSSSSATPDKRKKKTKSTDRTENEPTTVKQPAVATKTAPTKRVKLKRNFRKREVGDDNSEPETPSQEKTPEKAQTPPKELEKVTDRSRESSPEVIPMVHSPEVLCLSSESEGEAAEALARRKREREKSSIFRAEYLESLEQKSKEYIDSLKKKSIKEPVAEPVEPAKESMEPEDPEEGEIQEEDKAVPAESEVDTVPEPAKVLEAQQPAPESDISTDKRRSDSSVCLSVGLDTAEELDYDDKEEEEDPEKPPLSEQKSPKPISDEEAEDSGSDSGSEQSTQSGSEPEKKVADDDEEEEEDLDTIEIHDSSDDGMCESKTEHAKGEQIETSWNSRWLESSKVKKIIATSKLANKVRGKMKKKKTKKLADEEASVKKSLKPEEAVAPLVPAHELGSVKHYQDIVAGAEGDKLAAQESEGTKAEANE